MYEQNSESRLSKGIFIDLRSSKFTKFPSIQNSETVAVFCQTY